MPSGADHFSWPRVSEFMPTLNEESLLRHVLSSITWQIYPGDSRARTKDSSPNNCSIER
jgi:hypothetical protein